MTTPTIEPVYHAYVGTTEAGNYALHEHAGNGQWGPKPDAVTLTQDGMAFEIAKRMRKKGFKQASITGCIPSNCWQKYMPNAQRGQAIFEYALILFLIAAVVFLALWMLGPQIGAFFEHITAGIGV